MSRFVPSHADEHPQMIEDCEARESKLSDWERVFLDNVKMQLGRGQSLRPGQVEVLDEIWERVT